MKRKIHRAWAAILAALLLVLAGCGEAGCECNCYHCARGPASNTLFTFSTDMLKMVHLTMEERYVVLEDTYAEAALDILNSFVPLGPDGEPVEEGWEDPDALDVDVIYSDLWRDMQVEGNSIVINNRKYTGRPGSLDPLYEMFEEAWLVQEKPEQ